MKRTKIVFAGREIEFVDREKALKQIEEVAEKGTHVVHVIYGPEGCGKTALFKQAKVILEDEFGYHVIYVNPLAYKEKEMLMYTPSIRDIVDEVLKSFPDPYSRIVDIAIKIVSRAMNRLRKPRIAVLMDDIFQAIGLDKAEIYTKILLNLIEYPPGEYEKIVVLVSSSEGVTRSRIGRHRWADILIMWNISRDGFKQIYDVVPGSKPPFEDVWNITGGNPEMLERIFEFGWDVDRLVERIIVAKNLVRTIAGLGVEELSLLKQALDDPDIIFRSLKDRFAQSLLNRLIELNLVIEIYERYEWIWIDIPPPEKYLEHGIGKFIAWQTPLHREAVKKVLKQYI
ncbi:ATPase [Ignisphaera aggregans DSM 17230]|uniref:ATPase n=1 Tax=Ignisphaera aggregans (strain DSM 17230 / JCM 13409 / AQ1.S1) TaxID=583356 RepID=E0SRW2_IGNAA|nr:ATPase [Ignisphaera aggregans DSM 17230]